MYQNLQHVQYKCTLCKLRHVYKKGKGERKTTEKINEETLNSQRKLVKKWWKIEETANTFEETKKQNRSKQLKQKGKTIYGGNDLIVPQAGPWHGRRRRSQGMSCSRRDIAALASPFFWVVNQTLLIIVSVYRDNKRIMGNPQPHVAPLD